MLKRNAVMMDILMIIDILTFTSTAMAASAIEIDIKSDSALKMSYEKVCPAKELSGKANGILVFPDVIKAGLGIGGEFGQGALRKIGKTVEYYNTAAASIGLQLGAQEKAVILLFLDGKALDDFRKSDGWEAEVDGSVAVVELGAGGSVDTTNIKDPIIVSRML